MPRGDGVIVQSINGENMAMAMAQQDGSEGPEGPEDPPSSITAHHDTFWPVLHFQAPPLSLSPSCAVVQTARSPSSLRTSHYCALDGVTEPLASAVLRDGGLEGLWSIIADDRVRSRVRLRRSACRENVHTTQR